MFTHLDASHRSRDWLELASYLSRRFRLHVERVDVAHPTGQVNEDDGLCPRRGRAGRGMGNTRSRNRKADGGTRSDFEEVAACEPAQQ